MRFFSCPDLPFQRDAEYSERVSCVNKPGRLLGHFSALFCCVLASSRTAMPLALVHGCHVVGGLGICTWVIKLQFYGKKKDQFLSQT